jgi:ubiquinone/menaquinone biosynthesis C-methylase UbiE
MIEIDDLAGRKTLIKASGLKEGRILDIGMGNCGCMSFFLANRGFDVIGIDRSPNAVHESKKDAEKEKFKGTFEAKLANAENLPFEDGEFDAVFAYHSIHHIDNIEGAIDEMFRVCKQGGFILIAELHEKGLKEYEHKYDSGELLKKIEKFLSKYTKSIQKIKTKYNMMFICRK